MATNIESPKDVYLTEKAIPRETPHNMREKTEFDKLRFASPRRANEEKVCKIPSVRISLPSIAIVGSVSTKTAEKTDETCDKPKNLHVKYIIDGRSDDKEHTDERKSKYHV